MFFCSSTYGKAADCFAQGGMLMVLLPHSLPLSMPHTYYGSIELLSRMSAFLLKKLLYYLFESLLFSPFSKLALYPDNTDLIPKKGHGIACGTLHFQPFDFQKTQCS